MKKILKLTVISQLLIILWQCSSPSDHKHEMNAAGDSTAVTINSFLNASIASCLTIIELAKLAPQSNSGLIRDFGDKVFTDNLKLLEELKTIAASKNVVISDSVDKRMIDHIAFIKAKQGLDFNRGLLRAMNGEFRNLVSTIKRATEIKDETLKEFTNAHLHEVRENISTLRDIKREVSDRPDIAKKRQEKAG
jgi:hypothetical protein